MTLKSRWHRCAVIKQCSMRRPKSISPFSRHPADEDRHPAPRMRFQIAEQQWPRGCLGAFSNASMFYRAATLRNLPSAAEELDRA